MSCLIEIERRVLGAAENAATASPTEERHMENFVFGQRKMNFHYKCNNSIQMKQINLFFSRVYFFHINT